MKTSFFAVALAFALLVPSVTPVFAQAAPQPGTLIKGSGPAVYWYSSVTGRRHVFPNMKTFYTWFSPYDLYRVNTVTDAEIIAIPLGDNITYKPASHLIKITTDPKVYVVERGHVVRWIESEAVAVTMYGPHWQDFIDDMPDVFFANYTVGAPLTARSAFTPVASFTPEDNLR